MSKSPGKSKRSADKEAGPKAAKPANEDSVWNSPAVQWGIAAAVAVTLLVYLVLFFRQELAPNAAPSRFSLFAYLLTPDDLAKDWVEGSWQNFIVLDRWRIALGTAGVLIYLSFPFGFVFVLWRFNLTRLEIAILAQGIGLQLMSLLTLLFWLFSAFQSPLSFILLIFFPMIIFLVTAWRYNRESQIDKDAVILGEDMCKPHISLAISAAEWALRIVLVLLTFAILLGAMLPPWDFDVREYHLQVPKEWTSQGRVTFLPHNIYGNMPLGAEMHSMLASPILGSLWLGGLTGKMIMACYAPLTALALYAAGRRFFSKLAGLAAAAVFLSCPWVVHVCVNGLNESAFAFYLFTAVITAFPLRDGRRAPGLSGFLAGAAASCKYPAILFVVVPLAIYMLVGDVDWTDRKSYFQRLAWRQLAVFMAFVLVSCGLWYGKNWALTGNPVYPLLSSVFDGTTRTPEKTNRWNQAHRPPPYTIKELEMSAANVGWKDQFQSPLLVPLATLGIAALAVTASRIRKTAISSAPDSAISNPHSAISFPLSPHVLTITTLLLLFFLAAWWLFTHRLERFLVPAIPLAALLGGAGVEFARGKPLRYIVAGLMVIGLTYNLLMAASPLVGDNRWFVSLERLRTDEPKTDQDPSRVKAAIRWLNEHAKPDEAVLCVGEAAVFDLEMPVYYNTCFDDCLLVNWTENKTAAERKEELRSRKIAYVYFDEAEIRRYRSDNNYGYDPRFDARLFDELIRQGVLQQPLPNAPPKIYPVVP